MRSLKRKSGEAALDENADMELEYQEGNVLKKEKYTDVVRQGLLCASLVWKSSEMVLGADICSTN